MSADTGACSAAAPLLEGALHELALADVLQLLELGRKSGTLRVRDETRGLGGALQFLDGAVCGARLGAVEAEDDAALHDVVGTLLEARAGRFVFTPRDEGGSGDDDPPPTTRWRVEALLVEAARRADEWARLGDAVPHANVVFTLAIAADDAPLALDARQWAVLAEVDGRRDVRALARTLARDPLAVAADLAVLRRVGVIAPAAEPAPVGDVPSDRVRSSAA